MIKIFKCSVSLYNIHLHDDLCKTFKGASAFLGLDYTFDELLE